MKKTIAVIISVCILLSCFSYMCFAADDYTFYLIYSDVQANKKSEDQRYGNNCNSVSSHQLSYVNGARTVYLAKNEYEGFQAYFYEKGSGRDLKISVDDFANSSGEKLAASVYKEEYFTVTNVVSDPLADALVPYDGKPVTTVTNENNTFYIELHSSKNQSAGTYTSKITLYDGEDILCEQPVNAIVWNFALPEAHYGTTVCGMYNATSGYGDTNGFLKLNGVRFASNGQVLEEDKALAERILEGWQDFLLEHGISTYEIPRWLLETDEKKALLTMADTRRKCFSVPILDYGTYNGELSPNASQHILNYKELVYNNKFLKDKAFFYTKDEPNWTSSSDTTSYDALTAALENIWPDYHSVVPFCAASDYDYQLNKLRATTDILCPNQDVVKGNSQALSDFTDGTWFKTWRYQGNIQYGGFYAYRWGKSTVGIFRRVLYWQQEMLNSDGILHWNCAYTSYNSEGKPYNVWENMALPGKSGAATGNGDGILVYAGAPLGLDPAVPIASLRLKQASSGMDDYDYLQLAKEFLGEESDAYINAVKKVLPNYYTKGLGYIFNSESTFDWYAWECTTVNDARRILGNALSAAATEHSYGEWETVVEEDNEHNGLMIRSCTNCGAQESQRTTVAVSGDVNMDGNCNGADVNFIKEYSVGNAPMNEVQLCAADIDGDGGVDAYDAIYLDLYLNGMTELP